MKRAFLFSIFAALGLVFYPNASGARQKVDLILVLAVDASDSIDTTWWYVQRRGYADAFRSPEVAHAISSGRTGTIAVTFVQWSGYNQQQQYGGWAILNSESVSEYGAEIDTFERLAHRSMTSIEGALYACKKLADEAPVDAPRRVCDISGDGFNNQHIEGNSGSESQNGELAVRPDVLASGITINGLALGGHGSVMNRQIAAYYATKVAGGPDSFSIFVEHPNNPDEFKRALIKKLVREIVASR